MGTTSTLTSDQSWDLLRSFINAFNDGDTAQWQSLAEANFEMMQPVHFEGLIDGTLLTKESVALHKDFLIQRTDRLKPVD